MQSGEKGERPKRGNTNQNVPTSKGWRLSGASEHRTATKIHIFELYNSSLSLLSSLSNRSILLFGSILFRHFHPLPLIFSSSKSRNRLQLVVQREQRMPTFDPPSPSRSEMSQGRRASYFVSFLFALCSKDIEELDVQQRQRGRGEKTEKERDDENIYQER